MNSPELSVLDSVRLMQPTDKATDDERAVWALCMALAADLDAGNERGQAATARELRLALANLTELRNGGRSDHSDSPLAQLRERRANRQAAEDFLARAAETGPLASPSLSADLHEEKVTRAAETGPQGGNRDD